MTRTRKVKEEEGVERPAVVTPDHARDRVLGLGAGAKKGWSRLTVYEREFRSITADTQDAVKLAMANTPLSTKVKIPTKTNKVRFLVQSADEREIGAFEVDRRTIYAAAAPELPPLPCRFHGQCYP